MKTFGLLLAAGSSTRFNASGEPRENKLLRKLPGGKEVWRAAFDALAQHPAVSGVGLVASEEVLAQAPSASPEFAIEGGANRQESCRRGLERSPLNAMVLVHDAARPFVSEELISRVLGAAERFGAAIPATPVTDTIKVVDGSIVSSTLDRSRLFRAQTPQVALREQLIAALDAHPNATDEASALEAAGISVHVVRGEETNVKITTVADIPQYPGTPSVGSGFDIHAFSSDPARKLVLGGVTFEGEPGLDGHSDADVLLHALTDALLGAVGEGDIGLLFPNTDPSYAGADSMIFLREAVARVTANAGRIVSADLTLIAEIPKLKDKRNEIRQRISQELRLDPRRTNIKATTMEGMGAIGRKEGIAAMATVTVILQ